MKTRIFPTLIVFLLALSPIAFAGVAAASTYQIVLPYQVIRGGVGSEHVMWTGQLPGQGEVCTVVASDAGNNTSVHPGNNIRLTDDDETVWFLDVERAPNVSTPGDGPLTPSGSGEVVLVLGDDPVYSADLVIDFVCAPPTTTTTTPPTTTTEVPPSTTTTTTTSPTTTTTSTTPPATTTTVTEPPPTITTVTTVPPSTTSTTVPPTTTTTSITTTTGPPSSSTTAPPTTTTTSTTTPPTTVTVTTDPPPELPYTGFTTDQVAAVGGLLLISGLVLVAYASRVVRGRT